MASRWLVQTDFTSGELDPRGKGRRDLERFPTAVALARNLSIDKLGSLHVRGGWRWMDDVPVDAKVQLRGWQRDDDDYLLAIDAAGNLHIYTSADVLDETLVGDADGVVLSVLQRDDLSETITAVDQTQEHTATEGSNRQAFGVVVGPLPGKINPGWEFDGSRDMAMASVLIRENVGASPAFAVSDRTFKDQTTNTTTWDDASHGFDANDDLCVVLVAAGEDDEVSSVTIDPDGTPIATARLKAQTQGAQRVEIWGKYDVAGLGQSGATDVRVVMDGSSTGSFAVASVTSAVGLPTEADLATNNQSDTEITTTLTVPDGGFGVSSVGLIDTASDSKTMLFFHEDVEPHWLHRTEAAGWVFEPFPIDDFPYHRFQAPEVTIKPSATTGDITLTTSEAHWLPTHVGSIVRIGDAQKKARVTAFTSSTVVDATAVDTLDSTTAVTEWDEQVWSDGRGWPISGCWHQARLVVGGARDLKDGFWVSKIASGDENPGSSFDLGEAADDEAIWTRLRADEGVNIEYVRSQGPLLILASGTEWIVPQQPLTPTDISFDRQASQGVARLKPADLDGAIVYVRSARAGAAEEGEQPVIHFAWDELSQRYQVSDLSVLSQHLLDNPVDMTAARGSTSDANNVLYLANEDGTVAALHLPNVERPGMTLFDGELSIYSVAVSAGRLYGAAEYNGAHRIFRIDPDSNLDASATFEIASSTTVGTFAWLADQEVTVKGLTAAGWTIQTATADGSGVVTVATAVTKGEVGLPFEWKLRMLPPETGSEFQTLGSLKSSVETRIMVRDTLAIEAGDEDGRSVMTLDDGSAPGDLTTDPVTTFTGHLRDHLQGGWSEEPVLELGSAKPWPASVLMVNHKVEF